MKFSHALVASFAAVKAVSALEIRNSAVQWQGAVQFDGSSMYVNGSRVILYSGEYHPFRQGVPDLWLDVFQKIRSMGYTAVSFYTHWGVHEGEPGVFTSEGVYDLNAFIGAAAQRPGPYINGETAGGGIPGWMQRVPGFVRTRFPANNNFQNASMNYWTNLAKILAANQVDNGGPVILVQIENEYHFGDVGTDITFDPVYLQNYEDVMRNEGLKVPFLYNDITPGVYPDASYGHGEGSVQVYGTDSYPLGFGCNDPSYWAPYYFYTDFARVHQQVTPLTPMSLPEYQGGAIDGWGGYGYDACAELVNGAAERILYQTAVSWVNTVQNIYMTYGGTNFANVGQSWGYTSYDYGAAVAENRTITREKYPMAKVVATGITSNPEYLGAYAMDNTNQNGQYTGNQNLAVAQAYNNATGMRLFTVRNSDFTSWNTEQFTITIPTLLGNVTVPQVGGGQLTLIGRDSKIYSVDYNIGNNVSLWYSTADVFAYNANTGTTVLVVYGGFNEKQELAFSSQNLSKPKTVLGSGITFTTVQGRQVLSWTDQPTHRVVNLGKVMLHILDRSLITNYWRLQISSPSNPPCTNLAKPSVLLSGAQLMRTASVSGTRLSLVGDLNQTTPLEVLAGMPSGMTTLQFNGKSVPFKKTSYGTVTANLTYTPISVSLPNLQNLPWKYIDGLPEIQTNYDDSAWPVANIAISPNDEFQQGTPTSLSGSDYGFHTGSLLFRGHFNATGNEKWFWYNSAGGLSYSNQVWINGQDIGSYSGDTTNIDHIQNYTISQPLKAGPNVITVLIDHMGMDEQPGIGYVQFKRIRGISEYILDGHQNSSISWKLTGNFGGEKYVDKSRGPLNEGGTFPQRQGYHLPGAPTSSWASSNPTTGLSVSGIHFYSSTFNLNIPVGYDVPMSVVFGNGNNQNIYYRALLFINGWNYGKYINNVGPQTIFPVPEGVLNYRGNNTIAVELWAQDPTGDALGSIELIAGQPIQTGFQTPALVGGSTWSARSGVY